MGGGNLFTVAFVLEYQIYLPKPHLEIVFEHGLAFNSHQIYDAFAKSFNYFVI